MSDKPHISPTQIDMFYRCGEQYRRRYIEGEIIPPALAMIKGTGLHKAAAANFTQKIETYKDLDADHLIDCAATSFDNAVAGGYSLSDDEKSKGKAHAVGQAKDQCVAATKAFAVEGAPAHQPTYVEQGVRVILPQSDYDLFGVLDLINDKSAVVDHKVAAKAKRQDDADTSIQLTYYAAAHKVLTKQSATGVQLDVYVHTKKPYRQVLESKRTRRDFDVLVARLNAMIAGIKAGTFMPAPPGSWICSKRYCGYAGTCRYYKGE